MSRILVENISPLHQLAVVQMDGEVIESQFTLTTTRSVVLYVDGSKSIKLGRVTPDSEDTTARVTLEAGEPTKMVDTQTPPEDLTTFAVGVPQEFLVIEDSTIVLV